MKLARAFADIDTPEKEPAETTIKGYMPIGSVSGQGTVSVTAFELVIPSRQVIYHAVRFEIVSAGDYPQEAIVSVPIESAEKLMHSLEGLASAKITTSRFNSTEIECVVDDLRIVVFNDEQNRLHAAVQASGASCFLRRQSELLSVKKLIELAVSHLRDKALPSHESPM